MPYRSHPTWPERARCLGLVAGFCGMALGLMAQIPPRSPEPIPSKVNPEPRNVLFVGNSFTYYNGGLETHFKRLVESAQPVVPLSAERVTQGGATLKILDGKEGLHERIRNGHYDWVILQEDIPEIPQHTLAPFADYARKFDQEIKASGARTLLFMAWPYERLNWVTQDQIAQAHLDVGRELGAPVAPVGLAFRRSLAARPDLAMLGSDREHETLHGTYLAAAVIYATIYRKSPEGLSYCPEAISQSDAAFLQRIAWATVEDWQRHQAPEPVKALTAPSPKPQQ